MTTRSIMKKIAEMMYNNTIIDEDSPSLINGYGDASFPIKLTQRQAYIVADYLNSSGIECWFKEEPIINPKAVYLLWVRFYRYKNLTYNIWWGFRRVTECN